jgi:DNA replicative helicase MCM subunit Mcm2 (Cdc46/Mcm family)
VSRTRNHLAGAVVVSQEKENDEWKALDVAMENSGSRLFVKLDNVRNHNRELYETCIQKPTKLIPAFEKALNDLVRLHWVALCDRAGGYVSV